MIGGSGTEAPRGDHDSDILPGIERTDPIAAPSDDG